MKNENEGKLAGLLDRHFLATAGVAAAAIGIGGSAAPADAAIVYSGTQNLNVPGDSNFGLYINLVTNASDAVSPNDNAAGAHVNFYVGQSSQRFRFYNMGTISDPVESGPAAGENGAAKLSAGTLIGPASPYDTTSIFATLMATSDGAGGPWDGASSGEFLGVRFTDATVNGGSTVYGWIRISKLAGTPAIGTPNSTHITIVDWAYEDAGAGINAGAIPEPGSLALLAAGAVGLLARRGKVQLRCSA